MIAIADRNNDAAAAETALAHIAAASEALRSAGQSGAANQLDAQLEKARAVVERLKGR
jgi:hypothetical protein